MPPEDTSPQVTRLMEAAARGDIAATDDLLPLVYAELRRIAGALMSREAPGLTLQPTALVHEAYLRLVGPGDVSWQNRAHFFGAAAQAMRRILIDRARHVRAARVNAAPLGDGITVIADSFGAAADADDLVFVDDALRELAGRDERQHGVVMLRFFAGLTIEQTASAMGLSAGTVKSEWTYARAWLLRRIEKRREAEGLPTRARSASGGGA